MLTTKFGPETAYVLARDAKEPLKDETPSGLHALVGLKQEKRGLAPMDFPSSGIHGSPQKNMGDPTTAANQTVGAGGGGLGFHDSAYQFNVLRFKPFLALVSFATKILFAGQV